MSKGWIFAFAAYVLWGIFPIFWKSLQSVPASEILLHRMIWSFVFLASLLLLRRDLSWIKQLFVQKTQLWYFFVITCLISANWYVYTWGVNSGFIVETSLGYFINPLVNVLLGVTFLSERPRRGQLIAIFVAFIGVAYLTYALGKLPWISLTLAFSFGLYGLLKKSVKLGPIRGMTLETAYMLVPALISLFTLHGQGYGSMGNINIKIDILLVLCGAVTATPLLLFAAAAKSMSLTSLGIFQYIAPSLQFLIGIYVYKEPFDQSKLIGFLFVWVALLIFSIESVKNHRDQKNTHALARV